MNKGFRTSNAPLKEVNWPLCKRLGDKECGVGFSFVPFMGRHNTSVYPILETHLFCWRSPAWRNIQNNHRTISLLFRNNWHGVNL